MALVSITALTVPEGFELLRPVLGDPPGRQSRGEYPARLREPQNPWETLRPQEETSSEKERTASSTISCCHVAIVMKSDAYSTSIARTDAG